MSAADTIDEDAIEIPGSLSTALESCRRLIAIPKADKRAMFERGATDVFRTVTQDDADLWEIAKETLYEIADGIGLDDAAAKKVLDDALAKSFELPGADETPLQAWERNDPPKPPQTNGSIAPPIMTAGDMRKFFADWRTAIRSAPNREIAWDDCAAATARRVAATEISRAVAADQLDHIIRDLDLFVDHERPAGRDDAIQSRIAAALGNRPHVNGHDGEPAPEPDAYGTVTTARLPATIDDTSLVAPAKLITPAAWPNEAPPPVDWLLTGRIPRGDVTTLHGDGGAGKTDIALRLAANVARGASDWFAHDIAVGKVLFVSGEEPERELRRRMWQHCQRDGYSLDMLAENFRLWIPDEIHDAAMAVAERHTNIMRPTRVMQEIAAAILSLAPILVVVDNVAATFAGNQNDRVSVRSYVNLWRQIAHGPSKPAVLLLDHPSLSGLTSNTGRGGNMDWRNAVRSALYLRPAEDKLEADRGIRILETMKSNYGPPGNPLRLVWAEGGLQLEHAPSSHHRAAKEQQCEEIFLRLLDKRNAQGGHVGRKNIRHVRPEGLCRHARQWWLCQVGFRGRDGAAFQSRRAPRNIRPEAAPRLHRPGKRISMTRGATAEPTQASAAAPQPIAVVRSYDDLRRAVADHCDRVGMSRMELDGEAGLTDGHAAKLLAAKARKKLGIVTLGRVMAAAGLVLIVAIDPDAPARNLDASKLASRSRRYDRAKHWRRDRSSSAWGKRMAALRSLKLSAPERSEIARRAAEARWQRQREFATPPTNPPATLQTPT